MTGAPIIGLVVAGFHLPLSSFVLGILTGVSYGLLAVGLVLIYRSSRIINFAQGQMGAFGVAVMGLLSQRYHFPFYLGLVPALAAGGAAGGITEVVVIRRLRRAPRLMSIVATLAVGSFLTSFATTLSPGAFNGNVLPNPEGLPIVHVGGLLINQSYMAMLIFGPIAVLALTWFLRRTRYGLGMRCASANPESARMSGISAEQMSMVAWVIAGVLSALTAILVIPASGFGSYTSFGPELFLRALAAAVIARMYSLPVAMGAGIGIGVVQQMVLINYPNSTGLADVVLFVVLLVALLFQHGVGGREEEKGSWAAVTAWQPLSEAVRRLPVVRVIRWTASVMAVVLAVVIPMLVSNTSDVILSTIAAFSIVGVSVGVVTGLGGQLSLGQFAIAAIGAVVSFRMSTVPFPVGLLCAALAGTVVSLVIGLPALRVKGLMLTVSTLGFALIVTNWGLGQHWALGQDVLPRPPELLGDRLDTGRSYYYVVLVVLVLALLIAWNIRRLGLGRALIGVRDNEDNARAFTLSARRMKLVGFALAGAMAGVGGAVYGHLLSGVDATAFPVQSSIDVVAMCVIGGMSILVGPIIGAFYIIGLPQFVSLGAAATAASQAGWLLLLLYLPGGIAQGLDPLRTRFVRWTAARHGIDLETDGRITPPDDRRGHLSTLLTPLGATRVAGTPLLESRDLSKRFGGVTAINDVSIRVLQGEIVGLIGPNGAGKTTTFEVLSGFTRPDRGVVIFDGADISTKSPEQRGRMGLIRSFQDAALFPTLTVTETLCLALERRLPTRLFGSVVGIPGTELEKRHTAAELTEIMGLGPYRNRQIQELSTGTRRITELACLVALSPSLLLLDEPSSGVAQRETEAMGGVLRQMRSDLDLTMLIIEHDIPLIMGLSDRVIAMALGSVIADGSPAEVRANPLVIDAYLGTNATVLARSTVHAEPSTT